MLAFYVSLEFFLRAEMIWQRDAMNFYRGYTARSAMDIPAIEERILKLPQSGTSRSSQLLHGDMKFIQGSIPKAISPLSGRRLTRNASMVAHIGGRSKKPNAKPSKSLDDAMLEECHSEEEGSGKIEYTMPKRPTPAPRHLTSFRVEAMIHNPIEANLR